MLLSLDFSFDERPRFVSVATQTMTLNAAVPGRVTSLAEEESQFHRAAALLQRLREVGATSSRRSSLASAFGSAASGSGRRSRRGRRFSDAVLLRTAAGSNGPRQVRGLPAPRRRRASTASEAGGSAEDLGASGSGVGRRSERLAQARARRGSITLPLPPQDLLADAAAAQQQGNDARGGGRTRGRRRSSTISYHERASAVRLGRSGSGSNSRLGLVPEGQAVGGGSVSGSASDIFRDNLETSGASWDGELSGDFSDSGDAEAVDAYVRRSVARCWLFGWGWGGDYGLWLLCLSLSPTQWGLGLHTNQNLLGLSYNRSTRWRSFCTICCGRRWTAA